MVRRKHRSSRRMQIEQLDSRQLLAADPTLAWLEMHEQPLIGETVDLSLTFENAGDSVGFGPYVDVVIPAGSSGSSLTYVQDSASMLKLSIRETVVTFDEQGQAEHPFALDEQGNPQQLQGNPGDTLVVFELPFGSYTLDQPAVQLDFQIYVESTAELGESLSLIASAGFRYGGDALDNPEDDVMIRGQTTSQIVSPQLIRTEIEYLGPEDETATGENYVRSYRISYETAEDKSIENLQLTTTLDENAILTAIRGATGDATTLNLSDIQAAQVGLSGQDLLLSSLENRLVEGAAGSFIIDVVIPEVDGSGDTILDPISRKDNVSLLSTFATGDYVPESLDETEEAETIAIVSTTATHELSAQPVAVQQSRSIASDANADSWSPGDTANYKIDFQVSDYMIVDDLAIQFTVPDGQTLIETEEIEITIQGIDAEGSTTVTAQIHADPTDAPGERSYRVFISDALRNAGLSGILFGGRTDGGLGSAVTGSFNFHAFIEDDFLGSVRSGDPSVDEGDVFHSLAYITASTVDPNTRVTTANTTFDDTGAHIWLQTSSVLTAVHSINGQVNPQSLEVSAGDVVTFRMTREVRNSDIENLTLSQFFPLPIFSVNAIKWSSNEGGLPNAGQITFGENDTFHELLESLPSLRVDSISNSIEVEYGSVDSNENETQFIELLVSLEVEDQAFADGMWLTELASSDQGSSNAGEYNSKSLTQVQYTRPVLNIEKSAVSSDNPKALMVGDSESGFDLSNVDAGDIVWFETTIENTGLGRNGAYDVQVLDEVPKGFEVPATGLQLSVMNTSGQEVAYRGLSSGEDTDLFHTGIQLLEPIGSATSGSFDRVVIRYALQVSSEIVVNTTQGSTASIVHYAAISGGNNYVSSAIEDDAAVTFANASLRHTRESTSETHTSGNQVVIGEKVIYRVTVEVPEGTMQSPSLTVDAPRGLAITRVISATASDSISLGALPQDELLAQISIGSSTQKVRDHGDLIVLNLPSLINSDDNNDQVETIEIVYEAVVTNDPGNDAGDRRSTVARWSHLTGSASANSGAVKIGEPKLRVNTSYSQTTADAADHITVTMEIAPVQANGATAFDVNLSKALPDNAQLVEGSLRLVSGGTPQQLYLENGVLNANWDSLSLDTTTKLQYELVVNDTVEAGESIQGTGTITWTSLSGDPGQISDNSELSVERTGDSRDAGGNANDYSLSIDSELRIRDVAIDVELIETSHEHTLGNELAIGETSIYEITLTIPEGEHDLLFTVDGVNSHASLILESLSLASIGAHVQMEREWSDVLLASEDGKMQIDLGKVTNVSDNLTTSDDKILFRLVSSTPDSLTNQAGDQAQISAKVKYNLGESSASAATRIVEPGISLKQTLSSYGVDALEVVDAKIVIEHQASSSASAFEIQLSEAIQSTGLILIPGSVAVDGGEITSIEDGSIHILSDSLNASGKIEVTYQIQVPVEAMPNDNYELSAAVTYTSLDDGEGRQYEAETTTKLTVNSTTLAGFVFVDDNTDGVIQAGEHGIAGVLVTLTGTDHLGNSVSMTTVTRPSGYYEFSGLRSGTYMISETQPSGVADGRDYAGEAGGDVGEDQIDSILIPLGSTGLKMGYQFTEYPLAWIEGTVFFDENQDAILGQDEYGISDVTIRLEGTTESGDTISREVTTNSRGYYVFGYLDPGLYSIYQGDVTGYFDASEQLGDNGGVAENDAFHDVVISADDPGKMYNFGEYKPASIEGQVYLDYDRDSLLDRRDGLIAGVEVTLIGVNDLGEKVETSTLTDIDGYYKFDGLRPGSYHISSSDVEGLQRITPNIGVFSGRFQSLGFNGTATVNGFENILLPAGAEGQAYNLGFVDPDYAPSIPSPHFESQIVFSGTTADDQIDVSVSSDGATIIVNGESYEVDASESRSLRVLSSFGNDTVNFEGSENKETVELRKSSARITGTWFETLIYGTESISFTGGGNEDLARFYDTSGDDQFQAEPFIASMSGEGYHNLVKEVHRIYAYMTEGFDTASFIGQANVRDNFNASPEEARLYNKDFYLSARGFDEAHSTATDTLDRAYLYASEGDDYLSLVDDEIELRGDNFTLHTSNYNYARVSANQGGLDEAHLRGTNLNDYLRSRPTEATFDYGKRRLIAGGFERIVAVASTGNDTADFYDSHYTDVFSADSERASIKNAINETTAIGFKQVNAYMEAGGDDSATIGGSKAADRFQVSPTDWTMQGNGSFLFGSGFTNVTCHGESHDKIYLYDSSGNDKLEIREDRVTMSGQRFSNTAIGFGKVNSEASTGNDHVAFYDSAARSTIRLNEEKATIFGRGFSYNATGFDGIDAYYSTLDGKDNVDLDGNIEYDLLATDLAEARYQLSLALTSDSDRITQKSRVKKLL